MFCERRSSAHLPSGAVALRAIRCGYLDVAPRLLAWALWRRDHGSKKKKGALNMLVSIVVPVYNVERYVRTCLDSLQRQTLEDIEVICVDDGSTDGSLAILREYEAADVRFKVITKPNAGYGDTMNRGFEAARAPYVTVLESDDFCAPDMCERLYQLASEHDLDIVRANINLYWSQPEERTQIMRYSDDKDCGVPFDPRQQKRCFLLAPALCCMLVRSSIIADNNLKLLETPGASFQDTSFSFKLWACAKRALLIPDAFVYYRQDNEASSINQPGKLYFVSDEYRHLEEYLRDDEERFGELLPFMVKRKYGACIWNYERIAQQYHQEYAQHLSGEFRRARDCGMLDMDLFSPAEWDDLDMLIDDPGRFVARMDDWNEREVKRFHRRARLRRKMGRSRL